LNGQIIFREIEFDNSVKLETLDMKVDHVLESVSDEACKMARKLEELSSSGGSALSHTWSTDRKLDDVSSGVISLEAEFRELKAVLLDFVSSGSASTSRSRENSSHGESQLSDDKGEVQQPLSKRPNLRLQEVSNHALDRQSVPESADSNSHGEQEFEPLVSATDIISRTVQEIYPPLVSDYVSTVLSWQLLVRFYEAIDSADSALSSATNFSKSGRSKVRKVARQVLALRKFCLREGLSEAVVSVEKTFCISEGTLEIWAEMDSRDSEKKRKWVEKLTYTSAMTPEDQEVAWATRINSWLFQTFESYPEYLSMHRSIYLSIHGPNLVSTFDSRLKDLYPSNDEDLKKTILRYWFLDATMTMGPGDSQSSVPDTDVTVRQHSDYDNYDDTQLLVKPDWFQDNLHAQSTRPVASGFTLSQAGMRVVSSVVQQAQIQIKCFDVKKNLEYYKSVIEVAESVHERYIKAANKALADYGGDSDKPLWCEALS
jgi:hypothetical protein